MSSDPSYTIDVCNPSGAAWVDEAALQAVVQAALRHCRVHRASISIAVVGDAQIEELHERFCNIPGPTDVLTFDLREPATADDQAPSGPEPGCAADGEQIEGEIVASAETAARVARQRGHAAAAELALYAVHGTLHLVGHDDHDPRAAAVMHALEDEILEACGIGPVYSSGRSP